MTRRTPGRPTTCPSWCVLHCRAGDDEEGDLHVGGALMVRQRVLRLRATTDSRTGAVRGPVVLWGDEEYTLHQAEALIDALTQLVDRGRGSVPPQRVEGTLPVLHPELAQHRRDVDPHGRR